MVWNFAADMGQQAAYQQPGGKFIVSIPSLCIL
ncbi:MAG: hypothetical protein ACFCAD_28715 [Pleurocapsa sp.]